MRSDLIASAQIEETTAEAGHHSDFPRRGKGWLLVSIPLDHFFTATLGNVHEHPPGVSERSLSSALLQNLAVLRHY
jgi:hypothetical protein